MYQKQNNQNKKLRIAFFGTPALTTTLLDALSEADMSPTVIVTGEDKPIGRKQIITPTPAKIWALAHNIPILQPAKLDAEFLLEIRNWKLDLFVVVAYGKIIPEELINTPQLGTINLHYSLLPKYRGASPVETAILSGEETTGIAIQHMRHKLDSGPIISSLEVPINPDETAQDLRIRLNELAKPILLDVIQKLSNGTASFTQQDETKATFSKKISKTDGLINLSEDPQINYNKYRAYFGWPGTYFLVPRSSESAVGLIDQNKKIRVLIKKAEFKNNTFVITKVLPEGKKEMSYENFISQFLK